MVRAVRSILLRLVAFCTVLVLGAEVTDILRPLLRVVPVSRMVPHIGAPSCLIAGRACSSFLVVSSREQWTLLCIDLVVSLVGVYITTTRRSSLPLRLGARVVLGLGVLLVAYQGLAGGYLSTLTSLPAPPAVSVAPPASGDSIIGGPSLSASFMDTVLVRAGSPAQGKGQVLYDLSVKYHVDDAYALATFQHESTYGKYGAAAVNHSLGNIICAGYPTCTGRFRWYATWDEGFEDFYRLITREYIPHGRTTVAAIIPIYAPASENNTGAYIDTIRHTMALFRSGRVA